jgi:hypothetical protein
VFKQTDIVVRDETLAVSAMGTYKLQRSATEHSSTCHCIRVYMFLSNLLNVLVQISNKMGLQRKVPWETKTLCYKSEGRGFETR